jgi:hypothetical protein
VLGSACILAALLTYSKDCPLCTGAVSTPLSVACCKMAAVMWLLLTSDSPFQHTQLSDPLL